MSTFVDFAPSSTTLFQFLATLDGGQYNVAVPWNPFGERWYVRVSDLSNNVIVHRPIAQSGPTFNTILTWVDGVGTAALTAPHLVRIGEVANIRISQSDSPYDGLYQGLAIDAQTFTFDLLANPNEPTPIAGKLDFPLDLLAGFDIGSLYFHSDTQQFEF